MEINSSLFNPSDLNTNTTLANINPPSEKDPDDLQESEENLESMSQPLLVQEITDDEEENNKNCTVDENSEKIKAKESHIENVDHEKGEEDTKKSAPEKRTLGQYRAHLRTRCEAECGRWARVTCSLLPAAPPGTYRLLCVVRWRCDSDKNFIQIVNVKLMKYSFWCLGGQCCQQGGRDGGPLRGLRQAGPRG